MTRSMKWGVAILMLLLGTAAVLIVMNEVAENRELEKEITDAQKLADQIKEREVSENDQSAKEPISDPIEQQDIRVADVSNETEQEGNEVVPPMFSVGDEIDLSKFIELPSDAALAKYSDTQRGKLVRSITNVLEDVGLEKDNVSKQREQLVSEKTQLVADLVEKRITIRDYTQAVTELRAQQSVLQQKSEYLLAVKEALRQQNRRVSP